MSVINARRAVAKGAALLDERTPGWASKIDLEELYLGDGRRCVLGQLFPKERTVEAPRWLCERYNSVANYVRVNKASDVSETELRRRAKEYVSHCDANYFLGAKVLGLSPRAARSHGFDAIPGHTDYSELDEAWAEQVLERQRWMIP